MTTINFDDDDDNYLTNDELSRSYPNLNIQSYAVAVKMILILSMMTTTLFQGFN